MLWISSVASGLGATFYCLRRVRTRFGPRREPDPTKLQGTAETAADNESPLADTTEDKVGVHDNQGSKAESNPSDTEVDEQTDDESTEDAATRDADSDDEAERVPPEHFESGEFWIGLGFRLAQAEVYTLILFFVLLSQGLLKTNMDLRMMPAIALSLGLFINAAEQLVAGLADRLFAITRAVLPAPPTRPSK